MRLLMEMVSGLMILRPPAVGFLIAQQVIATSASAPESAVTTQRSAPVDQPVSESGQNSASKAVASVATAQEAQPAPAALEGPAQTGFAENPLTPTTSAIPPCDKPDGLRLSRVVQIDTTGDPNSAPSISKGTISFVTRRSLQHSTMVPGRAAPTPCSRPWPTSV